MESRCRMVLLAALFMRFLPISSAQIVTSDGPDLPDYISPCYREDPRLNECATNTIYGVVRKLVHGIPELDVPPIEPLFKDEINAFDVAGFRLKITNITFRGVSKLKILYTNASPKTNEYGFNGVVDQITIDANYELSSSIIPIFGVGSIDVIGRGIDFKAKGFTGIQTRSGIDFLTIEDVALKVYINDGSLWISNLGPFEVVINGLLNNRLNARFIMDHLSPIIDEAVRHILLKFSNRIFNTVPYDKLLLKGTGPVPSNNVRPPDIDQLYKRNTFLEIISYYLY